jgi:hypothetical protein
VAPAIIIAVGDVHGGASGVWRSMVRNGRDPQAHPAPQLEMAVVLAMGEVGQRQVSGLSAQSIQQTVAEFCECLSATTAKRKAQKARGEEVTAEYPWKAQRYRAPTYTNQGAFVRNGFLCLGHDGSRWSPKLLRIRLPGELPGRLMEASLGFGVVRIVCEVPLPKAEENVPPPVTIGCDLGVNTLIAATDGETAILVSGREAKAIVQYRNKSLAELDAAIAKYKPGSRRRKKLARRKHKMLAKCKRKIKDIAHKATAAVVRQFPNANVIVGEPFNDAAQKMNRRTAQQEALDMIQHKIGRILNGDPDYVDNWDDIAGYSQLISKILRGENP